MFSLAALALVGALGTAWVAPAEVPDGPRFSMVQAPTEACTVTGSTVTWGFKESFRSYLSGAIALGSWSTTGDVGYETPYFSFRGGEGFVMPDRRSGRVAFDGEMRFTGHGGILSTALANPTLVVTGPREATLFVDVTGDTMELISVSAENVAFATIRWSGAGETIDADAGTWDITQARVTLNAAGANAFGTYLAGEVFDPMDISFAVTPGCLSSSVSLWWWVLGGVGAVIAGLLIALWLILRGRTGPEPERQ